MEGGARIVPSDGRPGLVNLPKPRKREALHTYSRRLAKSSLPLGAGKSYKAKKWCLGPEGYEGHYNGRGVCFSLDGPCRGSLDDVLELGQRMAKQALADGDTEWVQRAIARMKELVALGVRKAG